MNNPKAGLRMGFPRRATPPGVAAERTGKYGDTPGGVSLQGLPEREDIL